MIDTAERIQGGLEIIDSVSGQPIFKLEEERQLCSITTMKLESDIEEGNDVEYIICGASEHVLVEFLYKDASLEW